MNEIWTSAPGYEDWLEVSNTGLARTLPYAAPSRRHGQPWQLRPSKLLKLHPSNGYLRVQLKRGAKTHRIYLHRLVAMAFVPGWFEKATVDHIDGNRLNNCANNLRWLTRSANTKAQNYAGRGVGKGDSHPSVKLPDAEIPKVLEMRQAGASLSAIGREFGVSGSLIHKIITGKRRTHAALP